MAKLAQVMRMAIQSANFAKARELLAQIYDWFTDGFDTADFKDAKALLDELS